MKCEILCPSCAARLENVVSSGSSFEGNRVFYKIGLAKANPLVKDGLSYCDHCVRPIPIGNKCTALTICDEYPTHAPPWETLFITLLH